MASHTHPKQRHPWRAPAILLTALALCALLLLWSNRSLQIERFAFADPDLPEGFDGAVIVQLSDLHCAQFGEGNRGLLSAVAAETPDYIFLTGDLVDQKKPMPEGYVETLAAGLSAIAPTYFVTGNHEWARGDVPELKTGLALCFTHFIEFFGRCVALVCAAVGKHLFDHFTVAVKTIHLVDGTFVVVQIEPLHRVENDLRGLLSGTLLISVFNAKKKFAAKMAGDGPAVNCRAGGSQMHHARGRGCNTRADFFHGNRGRKCPANGSGV